MKARTAAAASSARAMAAPRADAGQEQRDFAREWAESFRVKSKAPLGEDEIVTLFETRGGEFDAVGGAADDLRASVSDNTISYVVNRNIN